MQFKPTQSELDALGEMTLGDRMHYFLTRAVEAEEIWSLGDSAGWILREIDKKSTVQIWPYAELADQYAAFHNYTSSSSAVSLDHFVYNVLNTMISQDIDVEVFPVGSTPGQKFCAKELFDLINGLMESGDYYLEG